MLQRMAILCVALFISLNALADGKVIGIITEGNLNMMQIKEEIVDKDESFFATGFGSTISGAGNSNRGY